MDHSTTAQIVILEREVEQEMKSNSSEKEKNQQQNHNEDENVNENENVKKKKGLGWIEWLRGWFYVIFEMLFQRISASHLQNPMPLPPVDNLTCIVTGSTSGIGREIARYHFSIFHY